ncbi:MAG: hypothetical protein IJ144_02885 [Prevotella sp.]|nr:hypothetical protein [Prevotella sp.]
MDILERMPWMAQNAVFKRLSEIAEVASLNKDERRKYDESLRAYRDTIAVMNGQFQQGEQKGRVEGRAEGRAEGNIEGRTEERFDIARKMKQKGMAAEVIADITSLTAKEIEEL